MEYILSYSFTQRQNVTLDYVITEEDLINFSDYMQYTSMEFEIFLSDIELYAEQLFNFIANYRDHDADYVVDLGGNYDEYYIIEEK